MENPEIVEKKKGFSVLNKLTQGLSFKKERLKQKKTKRVEKFTVGEQEDFLTAEDKEMLKGESLKGIDTLDLIKNEKIVKTKTEQEQKALNRLKEKVPKC